MCQILGCNVSAMPVLRDDWGALSLTVSEVYDRLTVQGEGSSCGKVCTFIRLGLCNLTCQWCDTAYTWDWTGRNGIVYDRATELRRTTVENVVAELALCDPPRVVITGGEPLLQTRAVLALAAAIDRDLQAAVEVETNGTMLPHPIWNQVIWLRPVQWNVSPKLWNSGVALDERLDFDVLAWFAAQPSATLKFVCESADDVAEAAHVAERAGFAPDRVWVMPEGRDVATLDWHSSLMVDAALQHRFNITPRLHVQLWGTERNR